MKRILSLIIILFFVYSAYSITISDILSSKDVLAYLTDRDLYLMDLNTQNEMKIDDNCTDFAWDKSGQMLYTIPFIIEDESNTITLDINAISLPSLSKNRLDTLPVPRFREGGEFMYYRLYLDKNANLTLETVYDTRNETHWLITYNMATHRWTPVIKGTFHPATDSYLPTGIRRITTEGYGIINRITVGLNELYINQAKAGEPDSYLKLTNFHALMSANPAYVDYTELLQFTTSPDGSLILFGSIDKYTGLGIRQGAFGTVNSDGTHPQILNDHLFQDQTTNYGWLSDGRLVYTSFTPDTIHDMTLCLLDKQGNITTLKTFTNGSELYRALYRYQSK